MSKQRPLTALLALLTMAFVLLGGFQEAQAICGFPAVVISSVFPAPAGFPDTGFVLFFFPFAPFAFGGSFNVPLGTPFGDHAMDMAVQAVTTIPVNFMAATGPGPFCGAFCPPPAPAPFGFCAATVVGIFP